MRIFSVIFAAALIGPGLANAQDSSDEATTQAEPEVTVPADLGQAEAPDGAAALTGDTPMTPADRGLNAIKGSDGDTASEGALGGSREPKVEDPADNAARVLGGTERPASDKDGVDAAVDEPEADVAETDPAMTETSTPETDAETSDAMTAGPESAEVDDTPEEVPADPAQSQTIPDRTEAPDAAGADGMEEEQADTTEPEAPAGEAAAEVSEGEAETTPAVVEEPNTAPDPMEVAAQECLAIAGRADAGVPSAAVDAASQKETLAKAADACTMAAMSDDADAEVLFHAAAIAQARGQAGETFALLNRAAEAGLGAAETRLGDYFLFGVGPQGQDIAKAVTHYQSAAELGDAAGMTTLALLYQVARGVPRDPSRMVELMTMAADKGYHFAQYRLAQTYLNGDGIPGRSDSSLGIPDVSKAVDYYTRAADAGNLSAALELSSLYADAASGVPENPAEEVRLTRMVSQSGHPPAIAKMGVYYETGRGVAYDPKIAAGLYVRAMESGKVDFADLRNGAPGAWDRETALEFQTILQERGLYEGALDAIIGGGTAAAARKLSDG